MGALNAISDFIRELSADSRNLDDLPSSQDIPVFFTIVDEGTVYLDREQARRFQKYLHLLVEAKNSEKISKNTIEQSLKKAILWTIDIMEKPGQPCTVRFISSNKSAVVQQYFIRRFELNLCAPAHQ